MLSDAFSEGQSRDINAEFPSESLPYTEVYDYLSDSDLEDEGSCSEEEYIEAPESDNPESSSPSSQAQVQDPDLHEPSTAPSEHPPQPSPETVEAEDDDRLASISLGPPTVLANLNSRVENGSPRMGKVAIIRDMAAVSYVKPVVNRYTFLTCWCSFEAMLYFLYTSEIHFAPFRSNPRRQLPVQERTGDWSTPRLPYPSAKSIYRLADMVTSLVCVRYFPAH